MRRGRSWGAGGGAGRVGGRCLCWKIQLRHGAERPPQPGLGRGGGRSTPWETLEARAPGTPQNQVTGDGRASGKKETISAQGAGRLSRRR